LEELAWLGALENKVALGTMNRGGIMGATWELDDRITAYDLDHIAESGLDGGKTLIRIDYNDPAVARTIETVAATVTGLADRGVMSLIEPLPYLKDEQGKAILDTSDESSGRCRRDRLGVGFLLRALVVEDSGDSGNERGSSCHFFADPDARRRTPR
jgi:hypothetical protein